MTVKDLVYTHARIKGVKYKYCVGTEDMHKTQRSVEFFGEEAANDCVDICGGLKIEKYRFHTLDSLGRITQTLIITVNEVTE